MNDQAQDVQPYQLINETEVSHWHESADVIVVGCGAGGLSAAISAREAGASVLPGAGQWLKWHDYLSRWHVVPWRWYARSKG